MRGAGLVSLLLLGAAAALAGSARAAPVKLLVSIGSNVGDPEDVPLKFAGEDARRVVALFVDIGQVSADRAYLLQDPTADAVRERFAEVSGRIAELSRAGNDVHLLVYVSSHAKAGALHLRGTHLRLTELRQLAEQSRARVRVLVVDSCDSGAAARQKGASLGPAYEVRLEKLPLGGTVVISSSGPAEPSQEWDSLGGSLFTHHLLTGLRGDADWDGDGRVTLAEGYSYAYRRTVLQSASRAQHPSFDLDLSGSGELVLSLPAVARSALVFPPALEGRYVLASQPRPDVVAEVDKLKGRPLKLAVPPGRYLLRKRLGRAVGLLELNLPYGGETEVRDSQLVKRDFAEVALKGGLLELHPWSLLVLGTASTAPFASNWGRWQAGLALRRTDGAWWMLTALTAGASSYAGQQLKIREMSLALELSAGYRWLLTPVVPFAGASLGLTGYRQGYVREREALVQSVFEVGLIPPAWALGVSAGPVVGVEVPLWERWFGWVAVDAGVRHLSVSSRPSWTLGARGSLGIGRVL